LDRLARRTLNVNLTALSGQSRQQILLNIPFAAGEITQDQVCWKIFLIPAGQVPGRHAGADAQFCANP
jgi:hypothetical protein